MGSEQEILPQFFDAVVVGAGFSGLSCLQELRKFGFSCKLFEAGGGLGGTWYWNCYPGARVDTECIYYQFHQAEIGRDFHWTERFPGWAELQAYFSHVDQRQNFSRDIQFNTSVKSATFHPIRNIWEVTTSDLATTLCRFLILAVGAQSKPYLPTYPGLELFEGEIYHTAQLTADRQVDFKDRRVAVVGTGATGVQVIQELGPVVAHLTVFQRTPNMAIPMRQKRRGDNFKFPAPSDYHQLLEENLNTFGAVGLSSFLKNYADVTPEEREILWEILYAKGGFNFRLANFQDTLFNQEANNAAYNFWRRKTLPRILDPGKRDILAPPVPLHPFGTKRPCLEQSYFEVYNKPNVDLVDVRKNKIVEVTKTGLRLSSGEEVDVDTIVMATGFDSVTGAMNDIDIRNGTGETLKEHWKEGIKTYLGITTNGFPNFFFLAGPQAPADVANGPTTAKVQSDWLIQLLVWMRINDKTRIEPKVEAISNWTEHVHELWYNSLFPLAESWHQGCNIPGKRREPLSYSGGIKSYNAALGRANLDNYSAFTF